MKKLVLIVSFVVGVTIHLEAQKNRVNQDTIRTARYLYKQLYQWTSPLSYVSPPLTDVTLGRGATHRTYWISGDITPNIFIFTEEKAFFALNIQPRYVVRGLWTKAYSPRYDQKLGWKSMPVRTPSYMPAVTAYFTFRKLAEPSFKEFLKEDIPSKIKSGKNYKELRYGYFSATIFHHSNGQDSANTSKVMRAKYNRVMNIENGNFAIDMLGNFGVHFGKLQIGRPDYKVLYWDKATPKIGYFTADVLKQHYFGVQTMLINSLESELVGRYGYTRLSYRFQSMARTYWRFVGESEYIKYERDRILIDISFMTNSVQDTPLYQGFKFVQRFNIDAKYHFPIRWFRSGTSGLFIGMGYKGQDDYNVFFEDSYPYIQLGLSLGPRFFLNERSALRYDRIINNKPSPEKN